MLGFDKTGTWVEGAALRRGNSYHAEVVEDDRYQGSEELEIGYRPLIYAMPQRSFSWAKIFNWMWWKN